MHIVRLFREIYRNQSTLENDKQTLHELNKTKFSQRVQTVTSFTFECGTLYFSWPFVESTRYLSETSRTLLILMSANCERAINE